MSDPYGGIDVSGLWKFKLVNSGYTPRGASVRLTGDGFLEVADSDLAERLAREIEKQLKDENDSAQMPEL